MKPTLNSMFLHGVVPYWSIGILLTSNYGVTVESLHAETVSEILNVLEYSLASITISFRLLLRK